MRRSDHPSRPSAITCCRFSALKTLPIPAAGVQPTAQVNVSAPGAALAGFQVSINGRFWVSTEELMRVSLILILSGETYQFPLESPADECLNAAAECGVVAPCKRCAVPGVPHFRGWHTRTYVSLSTRGFVPLGALPCALIFSFPGRFLFRRVLT